jgi:hypothetical protein
MLRLLYSPECVEGEFSEVRLARLFTMNSSLWARVRTGQGNVPGTFPLRAFPAPPLYTTLVEDALCELRHTGVLRSSGFRRNCCQAAALAGGTL